MSEKDIDKVWAEREKVIRESILKAMDRGFLKLHDPEDAEEMDYIDKVLNKDTPKEPRETLDGKWYCPNSKCNHYIHLFYDLVLYRNCPWCGQKLDWSKENEKRRVI